MEVVFSTDEISCHNSENGVHLQVIHLPTFFGSDVLIRSSFLIIILCVSVINAVTTTISIDTLKADSQWSDTVIVTKGVLVPEAVKLTIAPGSVILFQPSCSLAVIGTLLAEGTENDSILFSATDTIACWIGMFFGQRSSIGASVLRYSRIQFAKNNRSGGAMHIYYHKGISIYDCYFRKNSNNTYGGAIILFNSDLRIERCVFSENYARSGAAAIHLSNSSLSAVNCSFLNNSTPGIAAALSTYGISSGKIINCLFSGNSGGGTPGCIDTRDIHFINCTMTGNTGNGGCFKIWRAQIVNSLFWDNTLSDTIDTTSTSFRNSLVGVDPMFTDVTNVNYVLSGRSPCIDLGTPDTIGLGIPSTDLAGQPRISCGGIDIGAFERTAANCPPMALDTQVTINWLYGDLLIINTSIVRVKDYNSDPLKFIVDTASGMTVRGDTVVIDSGRTSQIRTTVRATDGTDTTRSVKLNILPDYAPVIVKVTPQTTRYFEPVTVNLNCIEAVDPDDQTRLRTIVHPGMHYSVEDSLVIPETRFTGDLAVLVQVTDGVYFSDTVMLPVHVVPNSVPVLSEVKPREIGQWKSCTIGLGIGGGNCIGCR